MEELWQKTSELLWQRPMLWVPVLAAELLGFFVSLGTLALLRAVVLGGMQYHSALGGAPVRTPMNAAGMEHATILALLISWVSNFIRLLFYATALAATAALAHGYRKRSEKAIGEVGPSLRRHAADIFSLALRALVVYALAAVLVDNLGKWLLAHHHKTVLASGWLETVVGVLLLIVLSWFLAPAAVYALAHRSPSAVLKQRARVFAFCLGLVALLLGRFVTTNLREVRIPSVFVKGVLELMGSWIAAVPYVLLFVGLALIALQCEREAELEPGTATEAS